MLPPSYQHMCVCLTALQATQQAPHTGGHHPGRLYLAGRVCCCCCAMCASSLALLLGHVPVSPGCLLFHTALVTNTPKVHPHLLLLHTHTNTG